MQMKPHKHVHRGKGQCSFPLGEKQHSQRLWVHGIWKYIAAVCVGAIKNTCLLVCGSVVGVTFAITGLFQLHSAKCHSAFFFFPCCKSTCHLSVYQLRNTHTGTHTHTRKQASWRALIPYLVAEWPSPPLDCSVLHNKWCKLYVHV